MSKEPSQKIRELSPIDKNFDYIRQQYALIKGDLLLGLNKNNITPEVYQDEFINALTKTLTDDYIAEMKVNWHNDVAIGSYALEAFARKRIKQITDANKDLEPKHEIIVVAKYQDEDKTYSKTSPLESYLGEPSIITTLQNNIELMPYELREIGRDIEIINTINKISFFDKSKNRRIKLDIPETPAITEYTRLKNNLRYLVKNILYSMKEKKEFTAYDRASGRSVVHDKNFYNTIDNIITLMGDVHKIEYKPEKEEGIIPLSESKERNNISEINAQGEEAAVQLHALHSIYRKKGQKIPKEIYDDLKKKVLARAVIKGQTTSRLEWDIMTHLWYKWDREAIPHELYGELRKQDNEQFKNRKYHGLALPEDRIFEYILERLKPIIGTDNIIRYE